MSVSDLTGTKWYFNDMIYGTLATTYYLNFTSNNVNFTSIGIYNSPKGTFLSYSPGNLLAYQYGFSWADAGSESYRTIEITGGTDVTNSTFITWLESNATQIIQTKKEKIGNKSIVKMQIGNKKVLKEIVNGVIVYED